MLLLKYNSVYIHMPTRLTYEYVAEYIKNKGDELISTEYNNATKLLDIKCHTCNSIYKQTYGRIARGYLHAKCVTNTNCATRLRFGGYKTPFKLKPIICKICNKEFQPKHSVTKLCSKECSNKLSRTVERKQRAVKNGSKGGKVSATKQSRRSKNEVYFSELCAKEFEITTNEPYFDGWDADVIIHSKKVAILWNGQWHYKQITKAQSLLQVQTRDKIKMSIIEKYGYTPYIIKDVGRFNTKFVEQEFEVFRFMQIDY
jgi:hypothetical protein